MAIGDILYTTGGVAIKEGEGGVYSKIGPSYEELQAGASPLLLNTSDLFRAELKSIAPELAPAPYLPPYNPSTHEPDPFNPGRLRRIGFQTSAGVPDPEMSGPIPGATTGAKTTSVLPTFGTEADFLTRSAQADIDFFKTTTQSLITKMDEANAALIRNIDLTYDRMIAETRQLNQQIEGVTRVVGIRQGRARYAPELNEQAIAQTVTEGIKSIQDLESKRSALVAEAQVAKTEKQYTRLLDTMKEIRQVKSDRDQAIRNLHSRLIDEEKLVMDRSKEAREKLQADVKFQETIISNIGYVAINSLTGNVQADQTMIRDLAKRYGVDSNMLLNEVVKMKEDRKKYAAGTVGEYQFYSDAEKSAGRKPLSFIEYQRQIENLKRKEFFEPTADQKAAAIQWISNQPGFTEDDLKRLETDRNFFYWAVNKSGYTPR